MLLSLTFKMFATRGPKESCGGTNQKMQLTMHGIISPKQTRSQTLPLSKSRRAPEIDCFVINDEFKEVPMSFLNKESWSIVFSSKMHMPEHITLLEGRAVVQALRHKTRAWSSFHETLAFL